MILQAGSTVATSLLEGIAGQDNGAQQELRKWLRTATPKMVAEWLSSLPKSNIAATAQHQLHLLKLLDELELPPMQKFALLDVVRAGAYRSVEALTSGFLGNSAVFSENFKIIINQAMLLQGQLVACYTSVGISARLLGEQQLFIMGSALHRAMMDQYSMLALYLQLHLPVPQQLWRQLNRLFKVAEDTHLLAHVMGDNVFVSEQMLTIKQIYIAALLLGSARCNQLHADDVMTTAKCLKKWTLQADISAKPESSQPWQLAVDISGGNAPHFELVSAMENAGNWRYLHTRKLAAYLPKQAGTVIRIGDRNAMPSQELMRYLVAAWSEYVERDNTRRAREDHVTACIGIDVLHHYLIGAMPIERFMGDVSQHAAYTDQRKLLVGHTPEEFGFRPVIPAAVSQVAQDICPAYDIRVIDESITGYCLEWSPGMLARLAVGGVVGVKEAFAPYWKVGEIVWSKKTADGKVRTGIRTLANEMVPVAVRIPHLLGERSEAIPGFLLTPDRELGAAKPSFLSSNMKLKMGEQLFIIQDGNERMIQLLEEIKSTTGYSQFDYAFITQPLAKA